MGRGVGLRVEVEDADTLPGSARAAARLTAVVVLPTPPFWLMIAIRRMTISSRVWAPCKYNRHRKPVKTPTRRRRRATRRFATSGPKQGLDKVGETGLAAGIERAIQMAGAEAAVAAQHAEQVRNRRCEEEELMTGYSSDDLQGNWQFKIVRGTFKTRGANRACDRRAIPVWLDVRGNLRSTADSIQAYRQRRPTR